MTEPLSPSLLGSRARPAWFLYAAIVLYLASLFLPGEAGAHRPVPIAFLLTMGWVFLPTMLSDWSSYLTTCIWLSNFVAVAAFLTSKSRRATSVELAGLAVALGVPAFTSFEVPWGIGGSIVHGPDIGTYVWMAAYLLLFAHCCLGYRAQRARSCATGA